MPGPVYEAEIVDASADDQSAALVRRPTADLARRRHEPARRVLFRTAVGVWRTDQVVRTRSVLGYRARKLPHDLARMTWFLIRGHVRWITKAWAFFTYGDLRADARAARVAGDVEARREAQELIRADSRAGGPVSPWCSKASVRA
ncbi:hypothetical protein BJF78_00215 [Pseudonocardia sp. CNS-139]|nr:hypothetical protein BJF78_00215 [Pseudonocardia sp. CNS-139]